MIDLPPEVDELTDEEGFDDTETLDPSVRAVAGSIEISVPYEIHDDHREKGLSNKSKKRSCSEPGTNIRKKGDVGTSGSERCHLHEDQAKDTHVTPVVEKTATLFNLSSDDNPVRVWRPRSEHLNPAFALQRHTAPTAGVMVLGAIAYNARSPVVLICGTMTSCNHMCCHSCNGSKKPFINKTLLGLTSQGCHKTVSTLLLPFLGLPDLQMCLQSSISGIIWDGDLGIPRI
ncbi:uncharacterized protein TNCV_1072711 [Trichonephila clavipes]|nr:uncharacterized protein TNCV_1072711 [Trichonephila clavipes]